MLMRIMEILFEGFFLLICDMDDGEVLRDGEGEFLRKVSGFS
jgi:hypothetical protein